MSRGTGPVRPFAEHGRVRAHDSRPPCKRLKSSAQPTAKPGPGRPPALETGRRIDCATRRGPLTSSNAFPVADPRSYDVQFESPLAVPDALTERVERVSARLTAIEVEPTADTAATALEVALASDFVLGVLEQRPEALLARVVDPAPPGDEHVPAAVEPGASEADVMKQLRRARQVELARIAWRDIAGWADLETTLAELSVLADATIATALECAAALLEPRHGRPRDDAGTPVPLLVLAMGKLGGRELNFSSDVDLVFLFPDHVPTPGFERDDIEPYYNRLARTLIKLLDERTEDGIAFRVDARLRPFGSSGPLAMSLSAFESYLVSHGRDWERYAYVKARLVNGAEYASDVFDEILMPFVYRRYLDFGVFEALRQMSRLIARDVERREMAGNIKRGPGGIRKVEFIAQALQLVRGGQEPGLRRPGLLAALEALADAGQLGADSAAVLERAYRFLRTLENRLQQLDDRQTHDLPGDAVVRARVAFALGYADWSALAEALGREREAVDAEFDRIAWEDEPKEPESGDARRAAWEAGAITDAVEGTRLAEDAEAIRLLEDLREGGLYSRMDEVARGRLAELVARVIPMLDESKAPARTLKRFLTIVRAICRRSAYIALLNENPATLERVLGLADQSAMIAGRIAEHPILLDELLDARIVDEPPTKADLERMFADELGAADASDAESVLEALRRFQQAATFRTAIADRLGSLPLMQVSDRLTETAELIVRYAFETAWDEFVAKYGAPCYGDGTQMHEAGFAVVGYGKLGGLELGYGSDLDLVFLHDSRGEVQETDGERALDNQRFFARLVQRMMHFLTVQTAAGRLYEIDTRLRPSGRSGLMVASLENFRRYEMNEAWTWEHQALLRSRAVAGSENVCREFEAIRADVLVNHVDRAKLKREVATMRDRMRRELSEGGPGRFDLKQDPGGLADIEFLIDYLVLASAHEHPELVRYPDNIRQLEQLEAAGLVAAERAAGLREAYIALRGRVHELALNDSPRVVDDAELADQRARVTAIWGEVFG